MSRAITFMEHDEMDHPAVATSSRRRPVEEENTGSAVVDKRELFHSLTHQQHQQTLQQERTLQHEHMEAQQQHKQQQRPPTATTTNQPSMIIPSSGHMIRRTIRPSRSKTKLMRQVSALGMEDPVFRTTESGPEHPSNIFDDMGANHISPDMMDMVSIASDPTAVMGEGCDVFLFQMSLSTPQQSDHFLDESAVNAATAAAPTTTRPSLAEFGGFSQSINHSMNHNSTSHSAPLHPQNPHHNSINTTRSSMVLQSFSHHDTNIGAPARTRSSAHDHHHVIPLSPEQPNLASSASSDQHNPTATTQMAEIAPALPRKDTLGTAQPSQTSTSTFKWSNSQSFASYQHQLCHRYSRSIPSATSSPIKSSNTTECSVPRATGTTRLIPKHGHSDLMNFSLPSLDLEAVFGASSSSYQYYHSATSSAFPTQTTMHRPMSTSAMFKKRQGSDGGGGSYPTVATTAMTTRETSTDTLLTEAAMALEEQGSGCIELIEAAKQQHQSQRFNHYENSHITLTTLSPRQPPSHNVSRRHSIGIFPILENHAASNNDADPTTLAGRRLPTMSSLFPGGTTTTTTGSITASSRVPSRTLSSVSSATRTSSQNSSGAFSRRKSADGDYIPTKTIDTEYRPHQSWNKTNTGRSKAK